MAGAQGIRTRVCSCEVSVCVGRGPKEIFVQCEKSLTVGNFWISPRRVRVAAHIRGVEQKLGVAWAHSIKASSNNNGGRPSVLWVGNARQPIQSPQMVSYMRIVSKTNLVILRSTSENDTLGSPRGATARASADEQRGGPRHEERLAVQRDIRPLRR